MIPILYEASTTNFFNQGLGPLSEGKTARVTESRNGEFTLEIEYSINGELFHELENERIIKADAGHELKNQQFVIKRISKPMKGYVKIYAEHVTYKAADLPLMPNVNVSGNGQQALQQWQNSIIGDYKPFTVSSNITTQNQTSWNLREVQNARQALGGVQGSILDVWGGEYKFDNYHISLFRERGVKANAMIAYGRNLIDFEQEESIMNTYTSIYPYALWRDEEGEEHLITASGYVIDSEHVDNYPNKKVLPVDFTIDFEADERPTPGRLTQLAEQYIEDNDIGIPNVSIKLTHLDLSQTLDYKEYEGIEEINLCDNVMVKFLKLGVDVTAKVVRIVWNVNLERYDEIEIGAVRTSLSDRLNTIDRQVKEARRDAEDARNTSNVAANGINMIFYGPDEPIATKVGDTWYEEDGEYTIMRSWDGVIWRVIHDPRITDQNARDITDAQSDLENYKTDIAGTLDTINADIDDKFTSLTDITDDLQAITDATKVSAETAIDNSLDAISNAQMAIDSVSGLESTVSNIDIEIDEINGTLDLKADSQTVNTISGTVDTHTLDIAANAEALSFKADSSTVDTITGEVSTLSADIQAVAGELSSKMSSTDMQQAIDDISVGGRNYFRSTQTPTEEEFNDNPTYRVDHSWTNHAHRFNINGNEDVVFSMWAKATEGNTTRITIHPVQYLDYVGGDSNRSSSPSRLFDVGNEWTKIIWKTSTHQDTKSMIMHLRASPSDSGNEAIVSEIKIEKGNKATDWTPAPEDTLERFNYIETEWTQTFEDFEQTVSGIDGRVTNQRQDIDSINQSVSNAEGDIATQQLTIDGLQTTVADKASQSDVTQLSNVVDTKVSSDDYEAQMTILDSAIAGKVSEGDVYSQLLVDSRNILFDANDRIMLSAGSVVIDASQTFIPSAAIESLSADKLTAGTIDANQIDVIGLNTAHISGLNAEFVRTNWNDSVGNNVYIEGSGIRTTQYGVHQGTGNQVVTSDVRIGNGEIFMFSEPTTAASQRAEGAIRPGGIQMSNLTTGRDTRLNGDGLTVEGAGEDLHFGVQGLHFSNGAFFERLNPSSDGMEWSTPGFLHLNSWGDRTISLYSEDIMFFRQLNMNNNRIVNPDMIEFESSNEWRNRIYSSDTDRGIWNFYGDRHIDFYTTGSRMMNLGQNQSQFFSHLQMNNYEIRGQSDERLKENIQKDTSSKLELFRQMNFSNFIWTENGKEDFGLIAQEVQTIAPELVSIDEESDEQYLSLSDSKLNKYSWRAIQELAYELEEHKFNIDYELWNHKTLIDELKEEVTELKEEVNQLKGAA